MNTDKNLTKKDVSMAVVRRLPRYYRYLDDMCNAGVSRISSMELAGRMGLTASQIRQDFNNFGGFGQQGYGYNVELLREKIGDILGLFSRRTAVMLGVGNIGRALLANFTFAKRGFRLTAAFDASPNVIGTKLHGFTVLDQACLDEYCRENSPDIAILAVPRPAAAGLAERVRTLGIRGIWNFTNLDLDTELHGALSASGVVVENVHFSDSLMTLCYRISEHASGEAARND